ncbi:MAG: Maf family protein [Candidatus Micrarchaeota archaeon]|nr:Maf family protein [Candidatus Micrarchaeota archaeon]
MRTPIPARRPGAPPIILASRSPRRKALLRKIVARFACVGPPEPKLAGRAPIPALTLKHAKAKARWAAAKNPDAVVIAADTLLECRGVRLGKPHARAQAGKMLRLVSGRRVQAATSICVFSPKKKKCWTEQASVRFRLLDAAEMGRYLASGRWKGKAGGFNIEEMPARGWARKTAGDRNVVIGLPLGRLKPILRGLE